MTQPQKVPRCSFCNRKAVFNLKSVDGTPTVAGATRELGCEELYRPACYTHYCEQLGIEDAQAARDAVDEQQT